MAAASIERDRQGSIAIQSTQSAAAAFGDDIADDAYSVSELSHYNEDKKSRRHGSKAKGHGHHTFNKAKLSSVDRQESVQVDQQPTGHEGNGHGHGDRKESSGSTGQSDEGGAVSQDSEESDITVTTFASFAQTRFQVKIPYTYSCSALPQPLLPKSDRADYLASLASWVTILRIMGDMPDIDTGDSLVVAGATAPTISRIKAGFKTKYTKKDIDDAHKQYSDLFKDPVSTDTSSIPFLSGTADTMLDKVQMVCALGIYKPALRDELYSQLCKQLTNNPSRNSLVRGWVLMCLFAGSFSPSERLAPSLTNFVSEGPAEFAERVDRLLRRTCCVGTRGYPPSWLEFQAAKNGKPLLVPVTFMNGYRMLCEVDSATTINELILVICDRLNIRDPGGYAIYIALHTRISCLGNSQHRILDAISECEQHSKTMGVREIHAPWRLFFRRELFTPWYTPGLDPICTDLAYQQIKRGITMGEYRIEKEDVLMDLIAKMFYAENRDDTQLTELASFIKAFVPQNILERKAEGYFEELSRAKYEQLQLDTKKPNVESIKTEITSFAMEKFNVLFCRYYDVQKVTGPSMTLADIVIGLSAKGLYIVDGSDNLKAHIHFEEIVALSKAKHQLSIKICSMEEYVIQSSHSDDLMVQLNTFMDELKRRSKLALSLQDITPLDGPTDGNIIKGDILELSKPLMEQERSENVTVLCRRTRKPCDVPKASLYMIATIEEPKAHTLTLLSAQIRKDASHLVSDDRKPYPTLQQYAKANFRTNSESTMTKLFHKASFKKDKSDCLWTYSKDALKKPLLRRTCYREDIRKLACHTFTSIQTYMTNLVINDDTANYNLCKDWILDPARRNKYLREEIFCQVIKQITHNPDRNSEDRGWILLTLLTSLTQPSQELCDVLLTIAQRSDHPLSQICEGHLKRNRRGGACRLYSSHAQEHDMVVRQLPNVRVQVCLPDQSVQTIEVTSSTQVYNIKKEIAQRLKIKSFSEYSLFLTANDKVHCLPDKAYYFDCLSHSESFWFKSGKRNSSSLSTPFLVMLKKIWVNGTPGVDPIADQSFHFPQEIPNFQRGYHRLSDEMVYKLAALCYRAGHEDGGKRLEGKFKEIASLILPKSFMEGKAEDQLKKGVMEEFRPIAGMSTLEAKTTFLKHLDGLNTYGSVFFEIKQRHLNWCPKVCLVAINYSGVHLIDGKTKETIKTFDFHSIPNWAYDDHSFTFIVSSAGSTSKILLETQVGHNMDDLLMSYVAWIMNYQMKKKHGYLGDASGESIC